MIKNAENQAKKVTILLTLILSLFLSGCETLKYKKVDAKDFPPDPRERVTKNIEEGRGFRVMDGLNNRGGGTFEFASSNPLWKATL